MDKVIRESQNPWVEKKLIKNQEEDLSFEERVRGAENKEGINEIMSNPHHPLMKLAEDIIKSREMGEPRQIDEEFFENMVHDSGYDPALLAAICEKLEKNKIKPTA